MDRTLERIVIAACAMAIALFVGGCSKPLDPHGSPESVYRQFMIAGLTGEERAIRPLIIDQPDAALLWSGGAYPAPVAKLLSQQYREMKIERVLDEPDRVRLRSTAAPGALELRRVDGVWRLDVSPILAFRKNAAGRSPSP